MDNNGDLILGLVIGLFAGSYLTFVVATIVSLRDNGKR